MTAAVRPSEVLSRVEGELRAMWSAPGAPGEPARARACTMNLVVVAASPERAEAWRPVVDEVLLALPARAVLVGLDPDGGDAFEASTSAVCTPGEGGGGTTSVCSERIHMVARGGVCARVPSIVRTLCATDVPTTLVWLGRVHGNDPAFTPLAADAARVVLDAASGSLSSLAHVVYWARACPEAARPGVADLTWTRLAPWQELCARLFDEPRLRPLATHVDRLTLTQASPAGALFGPEGTLMLGWLATRLGWRAASLAGKLRLLRPDGGHVQTQLCGEPSAAAASDALLGVRIEASLGDLSMRGEVTRERGEPDAVTWRQEVSCGPVKQLVQRIEQHVALRPSEPARLLERTLHRRPHDEALVESVAWSDELRGEELACG